MTGLKRIDYRDGDTALTGWLARPEGQAHAVVTVFPTIANINEPVERRARMFAELGYLALVADFYGEVPGSPERVSQLADDLRADVGRYRRRIAAALDTARELAPELPQLAAGYCMGGQAALEAARAGHDLLGIVSFHGILATDAPADDSAIKARLLVCHGDADPLATREDVLMFWAEMDRAKADWHFHSYGKVRHGFTDPGSDARGIDAVAYDASADRQSWQAAIAFFDELLTD
jgi:dienelactone hydrolase